MTHALLQCTVALPQKAELISIESSELESDLNLGNIVTLHALIHNRAPNAQDLPVARRVFRPADYLKAGQDEKQGFPGDRDMDIKLHLDTTDLKPGIACSFSTRTRTSGIIRPPFKPIGRVCWPS